MVSNMNFENHNKRFKKAANQKYRRNTSEKEVI